MNVKVLFFHPDGIVLYVVSFRDGPSLTDPGGRD